MADNLDPELQRQLNEELEKFKESVTGMVPAMVLMTAAMKEQIAASKGLTTTEKDGKSVVENWLKSQVAETQASKAATEATKKYNEAMDNLNKALYSGAASLAGFSKALMTVGGGMSKYTGAVDSAGDAMLSLGKAGGPLGLALGLLGKAITKIVGTVLEYNDNMLKGTDTLSKMGIIGDITTDKFRAMGAQAGYSSQRLEELAGIYKELGSDIAGLGGSATEGAKAFNKIIEADENVLQQYSRLGVTQNQLNKNQADYIKLQIASGQQITERSKQDGSLRKASLQYTDNLLELSSLTGMEVDELRKKQEAQRADLSYSIKQAQLQDKELALRAEFEKTGNLELKVRADAIETERKNSDKLQDVAISMGLSGKELSAFNSMVATGNFNELSAGFAAGTPGILEFIKAVKEGKRAPTDFVAFMSEANKVGRERFGDAIIQSKEVGDAVNISAETMRNEAKFRGKSAEEIQKIVSDEKAAREKQKQGGIDAAKDARAQQETTERRMQLAGDQLVSVIQGPITKAFEMFQKAMNVVAKYLAKFATWLGAPDFTDMFKTPDELKAEQKTNLDELKQTTEKIEQTKLAIDKPEEFRKSLQEQKKNAEQAYMDQAKTTQDLIKDRREAVTESRKQELEKQITESRKLEQEKKFMADKASLELKNHRQTESKEVAEARLLELTKKKLELEEKQKNLSDRVKVTSAGETGAGTYGDLSKKLEAGGITDKRAQANILAQIKAESGGVAKSENLNYSGEKLFELFGEGNKAGNKARFKNKAEAEELAAKGPEAVGNVIYGGRMGNAADEGFKYRGRGLIQLTGKENYDKFGKLIGVDLVKNPDLANDPEIAQRLAVEYFKEKQKNKVDLTDIKQIGKAVGYAGGEAETNRRASFAQEFLAQVQTGEIHKAHGGGEFSGPEGGYPVLLRGKEMVIPMPDTNALNVEKKELNNSTSFNSTQNVASSSTPDSSAAAFALIEVLTAKLDAVIDHLAIANDTSDQLLKYSRV